MDQTDNYPIEIAEPRLRTLKVSDADGTDAIWLLRETPMSDRFWKTYLMPQNCF
jgi:hypothetical protein